MKPIVIDCNKQSECYTFRINPLSTNRVKGKVPVLISVAFDSADDCYLNDLQWKTVFKVLTGYKRCAPFRIRHPGNGKTYYKYPNKITNRNKNEHSTIRKRHLQDHH